MSTETIERPSQLAVAPSDPFVKASTLLSHQLGLEPQAMVDAIKSQFFKGKEATNAQLAIVVSIAKELKLNPLIPGQLYPYPDRSGSVVVMLGPDGIYTLLANNPDIVAQKDGGPAYWTEHGKEGDKETCTGYINHKTKGLLKKTIWVDEWVVSSNPNWGSRRKHMSEIRALKQAARMVIHGIPADADERQLSDMMNVTPEPDAAPVAPRPEPHKRAKRGAAAVVDAVTEEVPKAVEPIAATEPVQQGAPEPVSETPAAVKAVEGQSIGAPDESGSDQAPAVPAATTATQPRVFLQENEEVTVDVKVTAITTFWAKRDGVRHPSIKAAVKGGFNNDVIHLGGGTSTDNENITVGSLWKVGADLRLTLKGELNKQEPGSTRAFVQKVEAVPEEF